MYVYFAGFVTRVLTQFNITITGGAQTVGGFSQ